MKIEKEFYSILDLESMALGNQLSQAKLEDCPGGKKAIVAIGKGGETYRSKCLEEKKAKVSLITILNYIRWSKDTVSEGQAKGIESW
ncbi:MAG: hypothetical protein ACP5I2_03105 [Fervidicoccaceae archaeon]|jgi:hypothetical protein